MFANIAAETRVWRNERIQWANQRRHVLYLADQVNLAVFHKRPQAEIDKLLADLRVATQRRDN